MRVVYRLRDDAEHVANVQKATQTTTDYGIEPTHGLFGSPEWWKCIESGRLAVHTLRGRITDVYMAGMKDWPEFEMVSDAGEVSRWTREANSEEQAALYEVGRPVEIDYVLQRHRPASWDRGAETKIVLEIRVGETA